MKKNLLMRAILAICFFISIALLSIPAFADCDFYYASCEGDGKVVFIDEIDAELTIKCKGEREWYAEIFCCTGDIGQVDMDVHIYSRSYVDNWSWTHSNGFLAKRENKFELLDGSMLEFEFKFKYDCSTNDECSEKEYCAKDEGACDGAGQCSEMPVDCPDTWDPVCGCDEVTYPNACYAAMQGVNLKHVGECRNYPQLTGVDGYIMPLDDGTGRYIVRFANDGVITGGVYCCPRSVAAARAAYPQKNLAWIKTSVNPGQGQIPELVGVDGYIIQLDDGTGRYRIDFANDGIPTGGGSCCYNSVGAARAAYPAKNLVWIK